jgi:hypothetical protein
MGFGFRNTQAYLSRFDSHRHKDLEQMSHKSASKNADTAVFILLTNESASEDACRTFLTLIKTAISVFVTPHFFFCLVQDFIQNHFLKTIHAHTRQRMQAITVHCSLSSPILQKLVQETGWR